ncbi:calcium-dependent cysteine-type endopeptidase [Aureococcus anophagefferens]|nr:calcium-dependent cysteine-type endopeptidase [Aureococcus anophagefferens]
MASPSLAKRRSSLWARYEAACRDAALLEKRAAPIPSGLSSLRPPAWEAGDLEQLESASALDARRASPGASAAPSRTATRPRRGAAAAALEADGAYVDGAFPPAPESIARDAADPLRAAPVAWRRCLGGHDEAARAALFGPRPATRGAARGPLALRRHERPRGAARRRRGLLPGPRRAPRGGLPPLPAGTARTVAVDDLAPCHAGAGGGVLFTACGDRDKAWAQLLEKAAAKAFGSYAALRRGWAYEGLLALTGAPCEAVRFGDARVRRDLESGDLWAKLRFWLDSGSLVTASTPDDDDGDARADTVYTLLRAADVLGGADGHERRQALLLRDAGGVGPPDGVVDEAPRGGDRRKEPGTFWMDWRAAAATFALLSACHLNPSGGGAWRTASSTRRSPRATQRRTRTSPSGGAPADCYVAAHQADERGDGADAYVDLALVVLRRRDGGGYDLVDAAFPSLERQVATPRLLLGPGAYVVIAWSSGARLRGGRAADVSIVVHAATDAPLALSPAPADAAALGDAVDVALRTLGDASPYPEHGFTIHALTAGGNGVSFAVENLGEKPLDFTMDCGNARNAASHRGSLQHTAAVAPGALALLHHLSPAGPGLWSWSYECEWHEAGAAPAPREHDARDGGPFRPTLAY